MLPRSWRNAWITSESHGEVSQRAADLPLLALFSSETHIVLSPASVSDNRQALVVRREDAGVFEMRLEVDASALVGGAASRTVYGCAGAVRLLAGYYLVVLKSEARRRCLRSFPLRLLVLPHVCAMLFSRPAWPTGFARVLALYACAFC